MEQDLNAPGTLTTRLEQRAEERHRLAWLRLLITNDKLRHRVLFTLSLLGIGAVGTAAAATHIIQMLPYDQSTTLRMQEVDYVPFRNLMIAISALGYYPESVGVVAAGTLAVTALLGWKNGAYLLAVTALQGLVNTLLKNAVGRPRPTENLVEVLLANKGLSFPSGHVMFYTVFFGFIFFLALFRLPRSLARLFVLLLTGSMVLLVGPSRIFIGAHWLSDVLAAHILGFIILAFAIEFYLIHLAPRKVEEEEGLVGAHDRAVEQECREAEQQAVPAD